jgi:uncharacterized protein
MFPLERHTIFLTLAGSHAHGTAGADSDVDLRGVCIAPLSVRLALFKEFEQMEGALPNELAASVQPRIEAHPTASRSAGNKIECVIFDLKKFLGLCAAANPNALEILFADERDWMLQSLAWRRLHDARQRFLTRKIQQTFVGYAMAQLKRIETHRSWLLRPPRKKPAREEFGLSATTGGLSRDDQNRIEQSIAEKIRSYGFEDLDMPKAARIAARERLGVFYRDLLAASEQEVDARLRAVATDALGLPAGVVAVLDAEKRYRSAMKHWEAYQAWKSQRNRARAELEKQHGYDTKHAMHLIRLMRMGLEVLQSGELRVRRQDAGELSAIRGGALSFEELTAAAERLRSDMEHAASTTGLPEDVDRDWVDELIVALVTQPTGESTNR